MSTPLLVVRVECEEGHRGEQTPSRFYVATRRIEVMEVLDRWPGRDHRYFKVKGDDGGLYILRHDTDSDQWELTLSEWPT